MDSDPAVHSGAGAVFHGDITAGRDVTINHFTQIQQVTERLYNCYGTVDDASENLLGRLDVLNGTAEFVEEYAKELQASIPSNDPQLQKIFRECTSIHSDLLQLLALVENDGGNDANATRFSIGSLNEEVIDLRSRLMGLQMNLSYIHNKRMAKDTEAIKEAVTELMNGAANSDDASSIRTFYTASSIPYVERQMWRELEKALRERFTTNFVRDNYALIVATVEETVWETTMPPLSDTTTSAPTVTTTSASTDTTMPTSSESNQLSTLVEHTDETAKGTTLGAALGATLSPVKKANQADWSDKTGRTWASHIDENGCECLLTFDGGGVKSYSSILIMQELMKEVAVYENMFEKEFTHYPRNFEVTALRPCHYFDKMYGTSTGGILAIALSRLRMTVPETMDTLRELLTAMYTNVRSLIPLAAKYSHETFEEALLQMTQKYCKQHEPGHCASVHRFPWQPKKKPEKEVEEEEEAEEEAEDPLCQTICLVARQFGQVNEAYLLRTYDHIYNPDVAPVWVTVYNRGADDVAIWQAARATTAAPFYFKPLEVSFDDGYSNDYRDGGIRENNPSYCAYSEHAWHHGDEKEPTVLLSVGAGQPSTSSSDALHNVIPGLFGLFYRTRKHSEKVVMFKNLIIKEMEGQDRHRMMRTIGRGGHTWYKRLDVTTGLEKMPIDQWESGHWLPDGSGGVSVKHRGGMTMNKIQIATEAYLSRNAIGSNAEYAPPRVMLQQTAEKLVRIRRAREYEAMTESGEKRERWEVYMGKYLAGEQGFFHEYLAQWDYAMLGRKATK